MILSRGRGYLFIHIPKTGGTSLALALERRAMRDDLMLGDTPKARQRRHRLSGAQARGRLWKHSTVADLDGVVTAEELDALFCFTLVRNPWARVASYYHWLRGQRFDHPAVRLATKVDFEGFVLDPATIASLAGSTARDYMTDARGQERCDAVIRLEHLRADLAPVEAHLGFALDVPYVNASMRPAAWRELYTLQMRDAVGRACAEDVERFGYVFEA